MHRVFGRGLQSCVLSTSLHHKPRAGLRAALSTYRESNISQHLFATRLDLQHGLHAERVRRRATPSHA